MLNVLVREHLRRIGGLLIGLTALAAALPVMSVGGVFQRGIASDPGRVLQSAEGISMMFPFFALIVAVSVAGTAWQGDHTGGHVYALTLPVPRWHYALLRLASSLVLLTPVFAGFMLSALVTSASVALPPGLHMYPMALSLRFVGAVLVLFSLGFAMTSGTRQTSIGVAIAFLVVFFLDVSIATSEQRTYLWITEILFGTQSPLSFLSGQWSLVDV